VDKVVDRWCKEMRERVEGKDLAPRTLKRIESYKAPGGHFSWLYEYSIYEITAGHLKDWNHWLMKRTISQNTRRHVVETMRTMFRWLHGRDELDAVPKFPVVSKKKHVPNVITPESQDVVLDAISEDRRGIYIMAVEEVFRPGELRALNIADYDFKTRTITLRHAMSGDTNAAKRKATKEEDVRVRTVTSRMADSLESHTPLTERLNGMRPLFVNPEGRSAPEGRYNAQALRLGWKRAAKSVDLGKVRMYEGTKHSTLTAGRQRGVPLDQLKKAAGHKSDKSTEIYAELAQEQATTALRVARMPRKSGGEA